MDPFGKRNAKLLTNGLFNPNYHRMSSSYNVIKVSSLFFALFAFLGCQKKPIQMVFYNIKGVDYVSNRQMDKAKEKLEKQDKALNDVLDTLTSGVTKKPGVIFEATLGRKLNSPNVLVQVVDQKNGSIADKQTLDANPDMEGLSLPYNFQRKGDFLINFIVKDEIIAQGKIKYE